MPGTTAAGSSGIRGITTCRGSSCRRCGKKEMTGARRSWIGSTTLRTGGRPMEAGSRGRTSCGAVHRDQFPAQRVASGHRSLSLSAASDSPTKRRRANRLTVERGAQIGLLYIVSELESTLLTPRTLPASSIAAARSMALSVLPVSLTMPPLVLTAKSEPSTLLEYMKVDFTLVVIHPSAISAPIVRETTPDFSKPTTS